MIPWRSFLKRFAASIVTGCGAIALASTAVANVLVSETPQYRVVVETPPSTFSIASNNQQTTVFDPGSPYVIQVGPGQSQSATLVTQARFEAKPGYILTGLTITGAAAAEAWEGSYGVGGNWIVGTPTQANAASGAFPTVTNVSYNQNSSVQFPPAQVALTSSTIFFRSNLQLGISGSAVDCGRPVCARIGSPSVRVDVSWATAPQSVPMTTPIGFVAASLISIAAGRLAVGGSMSRDGRSRTTPRMPRNRATRK